LFLLSSVFNNCWSANGILLRAQRAVCRARSAPAAASTSPPMVANPACKSESMRDSPLPCRLGLPHVPQPLVPDAPPLADGLLVGVSHGCIAPLAGSTYQRPRPRPPPGRPPPASLGLA